MKPWTPVRVRRPKGTVGTVEVEVWGRSYRFGKGGIIEQVESAGRRMLSAPVELVAQVKNASIRGRQGGKWPRVHGGRDPCRDRAAFHQLGWTAGETQASS